MAVEQIVDVPATRRLLVEVPREIPLGRTILTFTPATERAEPAENTDAEWDWGAGPRMSAREALEKCRGIAKGSGFTSERLFEYRREDVELEEAEFRRMFHKEGDAD